MDKGVLIALLSTAGVIFTGVTTIIVAIVTNRRERTNAAEKAADDAVDQATASIIAAKDAMIDLRDDQIRDLKHRVVELQEQLIEERAKNKQLRKPQ